MLTDVKIFCNFGSELVKVTQNVSFLHLLGMHFLKLHFWKCQHHFWDFTFCLTAEKLDVSCDKDLMENWWTDQRILTRAILESKLCYFPSISPLWSKIKLSSKIEEKFDHQTCFHGYDFKNCNKFDFQGIDCLWWHFYPAETEKDLLEIYYKVIKKSD